MRIGRLDVPIALRRRWKTLSQRIGLTRNPPPPERIGAFISIPKNASKAVLDILELGPNRGKETTESPVIYENHQRGEVMRARHNLDGLFVFCFVRNPYDRCVSWYEYHRQRDYEPYHSMSFDEWVWAGLPHHWHRVGVTDWAEEGINPLVQYNFVRNCQVDFIGRMENFQQDLMDIVDRLNEIATQREMARRFHFTPVTRNVSRKRGSLEDYYSPETRDRVAKYLEPDFEHFGYER